MYHLLDAQVAQVQGRSSTASFGKREPAMPAVYQDEASIVRFVSDSKRVEPKVGSKVSEVSGYPCCGRSDPCELEGARIRVVTVLVPQNKARWSRFSSETPLTWSVSGLVHLAGLPSHLVQ